MKLMARIAMIPCESAAFEISDLVYNVDIIKKIYSIYTRGRISFSYGN